MFNKLLLGAAAGLTVLTVGAGIAAAQSDDDTGNGDTTTTVEEPTTDDTVDETTPPADGEDDCGDGAARGTGAADSLSA